MSMNPSSGWKRYGPYRSERSWPGPSAWGRGGALTLRPVVRTPCLQWLSVSDALKSQREAPIRGGEVRNAAERHTSGHSRVSTHGRKIDEHEQRNATFTPNIWGGAVPRSTTREEQHPKGLTPNLTSKNGKQGYTSWIPTQGGGGNVVQGNCAWGGGVRLASEAKAATCLRRRASNGFPPLSKCARG